MPSPAKLQHGLTETNKHGLTADTDGTLEMNFSHTDKGMASHLLPFTMELPSLVNKQKKQAAEKNHQLLVLKVIPMPQGQVHPWGCREVLGHFD